VEAITGGLFVFYYVMFFQVGFGPCVDPGALVRSHAAIPLATGWPAYALYMLLICVLLAASLIDAEHFFIPIGMIWYVLVPIALAWHAITDTPRTPGALNASPTVGAMAAGGGVGLLISIVLWRVGTIPSSFAEGEPPLEVDRERHAREAEQARREGREPEGPAELPQWTPAQVRAEIRKEMLFLLPPMALAVLFWVLTTRVPVVQSAWVAATKYNWITGLLGSLFGGLVGGFVVWVTRILGTLGFGRVAMGLGDVDLMFGVGTVVGAGAATVAFFLAPFFGIVVALYMIVSGTRRELPYGPYLGLASGFVLLFYCDIEAWLAPGLSGLGLLVGDFAGG
jgi:leader peptidase (prepilin peptidase)/N-methyltransferase